MERGSLERSIDEIFTYFRIKTLSAEDVIDQWYPKVKHIPVEAMPWIVDQLEDLDNLPRNIPKTIRGLWQAWKKKHPSKMAFVKTPCKDCEETGYLIIQKVWPGQKIPTQMMVECGNCNNLKEKINKSVFSDEQPLNKKLKPFKLAKKTRKELEMIGYKIIYPKKYDDFPKPPQKPVQELIENIGNIE